MARASGNASARGVICGQFGNWIISSSHCLGKCSSFEAKLWGILDELFILLDKGYKKAIIRTDNLDVVNALSMEKLLDSGITLLKRIQKIMNAGGH